MGKQIRRTITITLTETWTFVWAKTDDTPEQTMTVEQVTPEGEQKEEQDAALQLSVSPLDRANLSVDESLALLTPDTAPTSQSGDATPTASRKPKRAHRRRSTGKQSGM